MSPSVQLFLYLLTGVTLAFASVNLIIGLQKSGEKGYLYLGLIGLFVAVYYFLFLFNSKASGDQFYFQLGMLFFLANFALLPWFFCAYTGYCKKSIQWVLSGGMVVTYLLLLIQPASWTIQIWNILGHLVLSGIILFGFAAARYQKKQDERSSAFLLSGALVILSILTVDDIIQMYFQKYYPFKVPEGLLPFDYFLVFFMIVMGLKLARDMQRKYILEKAINIQEKRWTSLMNQVDLIVVGLDPYGFVNYINPFFLRLSGYQEDEVIGKNWFDHFIPERNRDQLKNLYKRSLSQDFPAQYTNSIVGKDGMQHEVSWSNVLVEDESGAIVSALSIGSDITQQQHSYRQIEELKKQLEKENVLLRSELGKQPIPDKIVGKSDALGYVLQRALQVADTDSTVLLEGETGVGKDLIANYIQQHSKRKSKPFIKINCAAIPASLLESELFGHVKGAFTGADKNKKGLVEMADEGTLFLDEVAEFPMELQPKLLRFLQEGEFVPLGSTTEKKVDIRIIAATNKVLLKEIEKGNFRNDLYYRLYVYPITVPALRERPEDVPELAEVFVKRFATKHLKPIKKVSKTVYEELKKYPWPGNIRELENILERAVIVCSSDTIKLRDLGPVIKIGNGNQMPDQEKIKPLDVAEREHIIRALKYANWKIHGPNGAAELLGINPSTLRSRIKKLDISK